VTALLVFVRLLEVVAEPGVLEVAVAVVASEEAD
jgi:hypothetical protein